MNITSLNSDILISLITEWFDAFTFVDLDTSLTNNNLRKFFLSILDMNGCILNFLGKNFGKRCVKWIAQRKARFSAITLTPQFLKLVAENPVLYEHFQYCYHKVTDVTLFSLVPQHYHFNNLTSLECYGIGDFNDVTLDTILSTLPNKSKLTSITLRSLDDCTYKSIGSVSLHCTNLKRLILERANILETEYPDDFDCPPFMNLEYVEIMDQGFDTHISVIGSAILGHSRELKTIKVFEKHLQYVQFMDKVEEVSLTCANDDTILQLLSFKNMTILSLEDCWTISTNSYNELGLICTKINSLYVRRCSATVSELVKHLQSLKCFDWNCIGNNDNVFTAIAEDKCDLSQLTVLKSAQYISEEIIMKILTKCSNLTTLFLSGDTTRIPEALTQHCLLKRVSLGDLHSACLIRLLQNCPLLERLTVKFFSEDNKIFSIISTYGESLCHLNIHALNSSEGMIELAACSQLKIFTIDILFCLQSHQNIQLLRSRKPRLRVTVYKISVVHSNVFTLAN